MENRIARSDNYLEYVDAALLEAEDEIDAAAGVFLHDEKGRVQLARALGQAKNALLRARRDLALHNDRASKHAVRVAAESYLASFYGSSDGTWLEVAVLPLPLEERISSEVFNGSDFRNDFVFWVTRFNNEGHSRVGYLMEIPGGLSYATKREQFMFWSLPKGDKDSSQEAVLDVTGALLFRQRLYPTYNPPSFTVGLAGEVVRLTVLFAGRLFEEMKIVPRSIAVQLRLRNLQDYVLLTPTGLGKWQEHRPTDASSERAVPAIPFVVQFDDVEKIAKRASDHIENEILALFHEG